MEMYIYIYEGKLKIKHIEEEGRKPRWENELLKWSKKVVAMEYSYI